MTRTVTLFLFACGLVAAAPVPKEKVKKIEEVFGEWVNPKSECKWEMTRNDGLVVTIPHAEAVERDKPLVARSVTGDFVATVRVTHAVPKGAKAAGKLAPASRGMITCGDGESGPTVLASHVLLVTDGEPGVTNWTAGVVRSKAGGGGATLDLVPGLTCVYLRLTRKGNEFVYESSFNGRDWEKRYELKEPALPDRVSVGLTAQHDLDTESVVTFDQYEIKPLMEEKK